MASPIPGNVARLDSPPPSPANPPGPDVPPSPPGSGPQGSPEPQTQSPVKALVAMGATIDQTLSALASASPVSTPEFAQARKLIQKGLAKMLEKVGSGDGGSITPTSPGAQFTGGGISGAM